MIRYVALSLIMSGLFYAGPQAWAQDDSAAPPPAVETVAPEPALSAPGQPVTKTEEAAESAATPESDATAATRRVIIEEVMGVKSLLRKPEIKPDEMKSLLYNSWQHALLEEAKRGFMTRPPAADEQPSSTSDARPLSPGIRELSLAGIAYTSSKNWTIWFNGQRVTPQAIPEQVLDIRVHSTYIELKWYDAYTKLIYPIRLRPHQRFNLDTRIFLPGTNGDIEPASGGSR